VLVQACSDERSAEAPHDRQRWLHSRPSVHLARLKIDGDYLPTSAAISPCGRFFAVSTPEVTSLFGILDPTDSDKPSKPGTRIIRLALPSRVPPSLTLRFGHLPAPELAPKKRQRSGLAAPAFRLFVGTACGQVLLVEGPANSDGDGSISTVHVFEEETAMRSKAAGESRTPYVMAFVTLAFVTFVYSNAE
jgi:hypothetical protein